MGNYGIMAPLFQGAVANQRRMLPGSTRDDVAAVPGLGAGLGARPSATAPGTVAATSMPGMIGAGPMPGSPAPGSLQLAGQDLLNSARGGVDALLGARFGNANAGNDKYMLELSGVPGVFAGANAGNPYAERQASQYLGTKERGPGLAGLFNDIAIYDNLNNFASFYHGGGRLDPRAYNNWEAGNQARANTLDPYGLDRRAGQPNPYHATPPPSSVPPTNPIYYNQFTPGAAGSGGNLTVGPNGNLVFGSGVGADSATGGAVDQFGNPLAPGDAPVDYLPNTGQDSRFNTLLPTTPKAQRPPMFVPPPTTRPNPFGAGPGSTLTPEEQRIAHGWTPNDPYARGWGLSGGSGPSMQEIMGFYGGY